MGCVVVAQKWDIFVSIPTNKALPYLLVNSNCTV